MLEQEVYELITKNQLVEDGDKLVLGVSGGPDSICMLDILYNISQKRLIDFQMVVSHINHGLRENAILDEQFVVQFCEQKNVSYFVQHADIQKMANEQKKGLEETGRIVRYQFFDKILEKTGSNKIAIAHNSNDRAETIIMNILRGTGIKGLVGMELKNGKYIRPLLETERSQIEEYLKENHIQARHDETNDENIYTRNKIRNIVVPYIEKEFNPNIIDSFKRLSEIAKQQEEYLEAQTIKSFNEICILEENDKMILNIRKFNQLETLLQKRVIFYSIDKLFGTTKGIEKIHMDDIIKLCHNNIGNKYLTPNKNLKVAIEDKQLKITRKTT